MTAPAVEVGPATLRHHDGRTGTFVCMEADGRFRVQSLKGKGFWVFHPDDCEQVRSDAATAAPPAATVAGEALPCPFCGAPGKMIHPMGDFVGKGKGAHGGYYGPEGSRIVCSIDSCTGCGKACYGPNQDAQAIAAWNLRTPACELDGADQYDLGRRAMLNALLELNPGVASNLHAIRGDDQPFDNEDGKLPFDVAFWITSVAAQLDITPREATA